jgi:hypothetical protein
LWTYASWSPFIDQAVIIASGPPLSNANRRPSGEGAGENSNDLR